MRESKRFTLFICRKKIVAYISISHKIIIIIFFSFFFSTFCLTDKSSNCVAVNLYNLAPGKGVIIGDSVAISDPELKRIDVQVKDEVSKQLTAFKGEKHFHEKKLK